MNESGLIENRGPHKTISAEVLKEKGFHASICLVKYSHMELRTAPWTCCGIPILLCESSVSKIGKGGDV